MCGCECDRKLWKHHHGSSAQKRYLAQRVGQITKRTVWALQQQIKKGDFIPAGFEVSFSAADNLSAMKIALSEKEALHLRGRIDRMDVCEDGGRVYVKIIDYKSGDTLHLTCWHLYYGLQLQLVVYMDAVTEMAQRTIIRKRNRSGRHSVLQHRRPAGREKGDPESGPD
ncbi:MAG: PD-(D/E)XK nuclease family protein [Clostridium sp.]